MSQLADDLKKIYRITELETENAELRIAIDTALRIVRDFADRNPIHEWNGVEQDPYGAHDWLEWYRSYNHCMCDACKNGVSHDACCAVHNEPAYTNGKCDCESGSNAKVGADGTAPETFAEWLRREMPAGTVIGDPDWWAPKILRVARLVRHNA